jgi:hypothetical protein
LSWFRRKPRITEEIYGRLLTSFGRVVDADPFIARPADALAERVVGELPERAAAVDSAMYSGATLYHLKLLAGSWLQAAEGTVPRATAEVFEEAVAWKFEPLAKGSGQLSHRLSALARGEVREP